MSPAVGKNKNDGYLFDPSARGEGWVLDLGDMLGPLPSKGRLCNREED